MATPLKDLVRDLDALYSLQDWDTDPAMSRFAPRVYQSIDYDYTEAFEADFCKRFNGLMLRSGDVVEEVFCAAFPSPDVLDALLTATSGNDLLFLHHPIDMEVSGVGFLPIPPGRLEQLRARGVSIYVCHAPMDCHDEIGTNASIVQAFDVQVEHSFARYGNGFAGRVGSVAPVGLAALVRTGQEVFGVYRVEIGGADPGIASRVAIVAGGGDEVELFEEAERLDAQVYITGEWWTRTTPPGDEEEEWAEGNRAACKAHAGQSQMAFLGFSHAASEFLVMKSQMADYFRQRGLGVVCLERDDWWR